MPFQASSLAMVQSTRIWSMSPACTQGRGRPIAWCARIFCVSVIGRRVVVAIRREFTDRPRTAKAELLQVVMARRVSGPCESLLRDSLDQRDPIVVGHGEHLVAEGEPHQFVLIRAAGDGRPAGGTGSVD